MAGVKREIRKNRVRTKKHYAKFTLPADTNIEYKNLPVLQRFLTDRGKIMSRRITGITAKQQRAMCVAIKRARYLGLLPSGGVKRI